MSREDLLKLLDETLNESKKDHNMIVNLGSHGVSPSYMSRYIAASEKIKAYENRQRGFEL